MTLDDPQAHDDPLPNTGNVVKAKVKSMHVPDDWDNDEEEEETDSQRIWETAYATLL